MTALALILQDMGKTVTGSDIGQKFPTEYFLKQRGIRVYNSFSSRNLNGAEAVIYSASHNASANPEVSAASKKGLLVYHLPQVVGYLTTLKNTVAVSGCHGKTTTTALISYALSRGGLKPSYFVGGAGFMNYLSGAWNKGKWFVVEADEYLADPFSVRKAKFLFYHPQSIIVTNLDYDHPDFYPNFEAVKKVFARFFRRLGENKKLIINGDDKVLLTLAKKTQTRYLTYGFGSHNLYRIVAKGNNLQILYRNKLLTGLQPQLFGKHNMMNLAAATVFLHQTQADFLELAKFLNEFTGVKRRLELVAKIKRNLVFDDYGHHPAEIEAGLQALRTRYPHYSIALCFQPHTFSRTRALLADFAFALSKVDYLGLLPIFRSAREKADFNFKLEEITDKLDKRVPWQIIKSSADWQRLVLETQKTKQPWIYVTMGAGDIFKKTKLITKYLSYE